MNHDLLLARACETNAGYCALGNERFEAHGATFVRNRRTPRRHDANGVFLVRTESAKDIGSLLGRAEAEFYGMQHRYWSIDALTPPAFVARLALEDGYKHQEFLVHVLEGELQATAKDVEVREVLSEDDWAAYDELDAMWWKETSTGALGPFDRSLMDEFMLNHRLKQPAVRSWFACVDGVPRAFFSSWPGDNGVGMVEDLYCHPDYRHRGLATALIARCVADARDRGAGPVIIASDPQETPKHLYAAMGFRPLYVTRTYTREPPKQGERREGA